MTSLRIPIRHRRQKEPVLWVIDSEQWPRACLRAELIERGYDPYGFMTIRDALVSLSWQPPPKPEVIILELRDQDLTEQLIEAVRGLRIPTIILGGAAELNEPLVHARQWQVVLKRPVTLGRIADVVENIIPAHRVL
jgi:DNA-binding NtrC family response regulator